MIAYKAANFLIRTYTVVFTFGFLIFAFNICIWTLFLPSTKVRLTSFLDNKLMMEIHFLTELKFKKIMTSYALMVII